MSTKKRAADYERQLMNLFWDNGFAVLRAPASSGTTKIHTPDIFAGSKERGLFIAIELKTSRQNFFYVKKSQIRGLLEFSRRMGAQAYLAVKFIGKRTGFLFLSVPDALIDSRGDSYIVRLKDVKERGISFEELISETSPK